MLSTKLIGLANWIGEQGTDIPQPLRNVLIHQLNSFGADAAELERHVVPHAARIVEPGGNVVMLDKRRAQ